MTIKELRKYAQLLEENGYGNNEVRMLNLWSEEESNTCSYEVDYPVVTSLKIDDKKNLIISNLSIDK